jgi:hypothetical protein
MASSLFVPILRGKEEAPSVLEVRLINCHHFFDRGIEHSEFFVRRQECKRLSIELHPLKVLLTLRPQVVCVHMHMAACVFPLALPFLVQFTQCEGGSRVLCIAPCRLGCGSGFLKQLRRDCCGPDVIQRHFDGGFGGDIDHIDHGLVFQRVRSGIFSGHH